MIESPGSFSAHKQRLDAAYARCKYDTMLGSLMEIMANSLDVSGTENHDRKKQKTQMKTTGGANNVVKSRFALGADDGAYLRTSVVPLQTALDESNLERGRLSMKLTAEMKFSSYRGVLGAYLDSCNKRISDQDAQLNAIWQMVAWALSMPEVREYVLLRIQTHENFHENNVQAGESSDAWQHEEWKCASKKAQSIVSDSSSYSFTPSLDNIADVNAVSMIFHSILVLVTKLGTSVEKDVVTQLEEAQKTAESVASQVATVNNFLGYESEFEEEGWFENRRRVVADDVNAENNIAEKRWFKDLGARFLAYDKQLSSFVENNESVHWAVKFCAMRGLCARRAVHHKADGNEAALLYNVPTRKFPSLEVLAGATCSNATAGVLTVYEHKTVGKAVSDFCSFDEQYVTTAAAWAPVTEEQPNKYDTSPETQAVSEAAVIEHLIDYYNGKAAEEKEKEVDAMRSEQKQDFAAHRNNRISYMACSALAKLKQLRHIATAFDQPPNGLNQLCPATGYQTNPVLKDGDRIVYPADAGLVSLETEESTTIKKGQLKELVERKKIGAQPSSVDYEDITNEMINDLGFSDSKIAVTPTVDKTDDPKSPQSRQIAFSVLFTREQAERMYDQHLHNAVYTGVSLLQKRETWLIEKNATELALKELTVSQIRSVESESAHTERVARTRREEIWNDAMREAAICGDRLYAFARQFSGCINESIDAVCMIDETVLVRQQKDREEQEKKMSNLASQTYMSLVSRVFSGVVAESGLTLGISTQGGRGEKRGLDGELKIVSNSLRKQVAELATGSGGDGFFTNSVKLENLLAQGTGELTLSGLFAKLKEVGDALQSAALNHEDDSSTLTTPSLDYLSAPRNSLLLRWKPEAHAAIRTAYEVFQREMRFSYERYGHLGATRKISAFELMEGRSDELTMAFATYCAHTLAHQRMFSASNAMYLSNWSSSANVAALRFYCSKLVNVALDYAASTQRPHFLHERGWELYFSMRS